MFPRDQAQPETVNPNESLIAGWAGGSILNNIEGGDVVVGDKVIFVGVSSRTSLQAIEELKKVLIIKKIKKEVIPINFDNSMLHLDCVFNLVGEESALVSPYVYDKDVVKKYIKNINDSILILYYFLENIKNNDNGNMGIKIFQKKERILWGKG